jgi:hypothetical protein
VDEVELVGRLGERQLRAPRGGASQEHDVALDDGRRAGGGKRAAPHERGHLSGAAHHHHWFGAEHAAEPPARARHDRLDPAGLGVEQHVAAGDEGADVGAAGACEGIPQRVLRHEAAAAHVHRAQQRNVGAAPSRGSRVSGSLAPRSRRA